MAQVLVNFRLDEEVKKDMEQACREMGLSMSTAFTIFAKKVGKEKRIPFEIAAESSAPGPYQRQRRSAERGQEEKALVFARKQERLELLHGAIRRSLTAIHAAIPSSITGLTMERIRMLCGDELKDRAAEATKASRELFSDRNRHMLPEKDLSILDAYIEGLSSVAGELLELEHTLIPAMKAWHGEEDASCFEPYAQQLAGVSRKLFELPDLTRLFLSSVGGAQMIKSRLQRAARTVETTYVLSALETMEAQLLRHYDCLDGPTKQRLEDDYLPTLELTMQALAQAEQDGEDVAGKAALCLRAVNVLSQVISDGLRFRREWSDRSLESEVAALERLAAMRGDIPDGVNL